MRFVLFALVAMLLAACSGSSDAASFVVTCPEPVDAPAEYCSTTTAEDDGTCRVTWDNECLNRWCHEDPSYQSCGTEQT